MTLSQHFQETAQKFDKKFVEYGIGGQSRINVDLPVYEIEDFLLTSQQETVRVMLSDIEGMKKEFENASDEQQWKGDKSREEVLLLKATHGLQFVLDRADGIREMKSLAVKALTDLTTKLQEELK